MMTDERELLPLPRAWSIKGAGRGVGVGRRPSRTGKDNGPVQGTIRGWMGRALRRKVPLLVSLSRCTRLPALSS